ncbi:ABC transporter permease [Deinococcus cellulosilyticus]|uniref:ABC transporter permease n=1 Tax=Deinococcus cellulosilyticus (strain DSM 18568 / NBRC 106333 / KACC 11606 / 5516J-15) TaxID=1223518 RepID=A0A511N0G9_DEIC1|nr:ABC transporter permease [Deinococcus cellulosilyticus]GEM46343.1 ABC transporter permease [Deinococcus cellulosilyticus NBRC 106333 = KACC 11606]
MSGPMSALQMAVRSILGNRLRSVLTSLGIIIGVSSVIILTALGEGSSRKIQAEVEKLGSNQLTVTPQMGSTSTLTLRDATEIQQQLASQVVAVSPTIQSNQKVRNGEKNVSATVIGGWPELQALKNITLQSGRFFTAEDNEGRRRVAVLGLNVARKLFGMKNALGERVKIAGISFEVIGTLPDQGGDGFFSMNDQVLVPIETYQQRLGRSSEARRDGVDSITVQGKDRGTLKQLEVQLKQVVRSSHTLEVEEDDDFSIFNQADALATFNQVNRSLMLLLVGIASISLLVGGIGIMNIMLVSVTERTREIGLRKAIGATPASIQLQFTIEAVVLSLSGGALGILVGLLGTWIAHQFAGSPVFVTWWSVAVSFLFSLVVGVLFGFLPAARAASLDPVQALRYE